MMMNIIINLTTYVTGKGPSLRGTQQADNKQLDPWQGIYTLQHTIVINYKEFKYTMTSKKVK